MKNSNWLGCFFTVFVITSFNSVAFGDVGINLKNAISNTKSACSGIGDSMRDLKIKAGINTAVTGVGTVSSGVALGTGIAKTGVDREYDNLVKKVNALIAEKSNTPIEPIDIDEENASEQISDVVSSMSGDMEKISELEQKSKTLGDIRTGTLAASTVTNVAGTAIAAINKVDENLEEKINKCISAVKELSNAKLAAKVEGVATDSEISQAEKIINACRDYEVIDLKPINKRAMGAAISSGIGAGTGVVGTITSAAANTDATRSGEDKKEKKLNTMSNVMAGATTAAGATATILNATQISAIKKVVTVATECEEALR